MNTKSFLLSVFLFCGIFFLFRILFLPHANIQTYRLIGEPLPNFTLPSLNPPGSFFSQQEIKGKLSIIVLFASWCEPCQAEQPTLMAIQKQTSIPIYGIDYKDTPQEALSFLQQYGNPFQKIGLDQNGQTLIDLGASGTPETYIINAKGEIIYRHAGLLTMEDWNHILLPIIEKNR